MRHGIVWLVSVLALAQCVHAEDAKQAGKANPQTAKQVTFSDDFQTDRRAEYAITGPVQWEKGRLRLGKGTSVRKALQIGPVALVKLELNWPRLDADGQTTGLSFGWEVEDSGTLWIELTCSRDQQKTATALRIIDTWTKTTGEGDSAKSEQVRETIRTFSGLADTDLSKLTISYHYGLVRVYSQGKRIGIGQVPYGTSPIDAFVMHTLNCEAACTTLALNGTSRTSPLTDEQHKEVAEMGRLNSELVKLYRVGKFAQAVPFGQKALAISKRTFGNTSLDYATRLNNLALMYNEMGECAKAEPLYLQALSIRKEVLGQRHPGYATSLNNLALLYESMGEYTKALPLFRQALSIRKDVLGPRHPDYAASLDSLAHLHWLMGDYTKAEPLYLQALRINKEALGEQHPRYATILNNLASLYEDMGDYTKAEPLCLQALSIREEVLGPRHPEYAASLNSLAVLYWSMGDYVKAETLFLQARDIYKEALGEQHSSYATILNNLAGLYEDMGDYAKAEPLYLQALRIDKEVLGPRHPKYATSLNNLALLYKSMGDYAKAEPLYLQALRIHEEALRPRHPDYATSLNNLALLYQDMGDYAKAEPLYLQALRIHEEVFGQQHASYAMDLNNLAGIYRDMGDYAKAKPLLVQALSIHMEVLGPWHPRYAASLTNLMALYWSMGNYAKAEPLARQAFLVEQTFAKKTLPWLPESRAMTMRGEQLGCDPWLSSLRKLPDVDAADAYSAVWQSRALVTRILGNRRKLLSDSPEAQALYAKLQSTSQQLAQLTLATPKPKLRERRRKQLAKLNERKEQLQTQLAVLSQEFRRSQQVTEARVADLASLLPMDTAVVDLVQMRVWRPPVDGKGEATSQRHYEAFVLRRATGKPGYNVAWIHLGPAKPIDQAIARWRARNTPDALANASTQSTRSRDTGSMPEQAPGGVLRRLIWQKIEPQLTGCASVVIVPDADLNFVAWAALPGGKPGTYLIEDYAIATVGHGQQLYALLTEPSTPEGGLLLVGGVAYGSRPATPSTPSPSTPGTTVPDTQLAALDSSDRPRTRGPATTTRLQWGPLDDTKREVDAIRQLQPSQVVSRTLEGSAASEQALRRAMPSNRYVHLATHGFFADQKFRSAFGHIETSDRLSGPGQDLVTAKRSGVTVRNPLILSGIVLAGANLPPETDSLGLSTGEDGILTAEEIVSLGLQDTELVVLSACDTGLGKVGGNEGVMGLTRAFHMAGARTVVASLWHVDDAATRALMVKFYTNLWQKKMSKLDALRDAQLWMLRHPEQLEALGVKDARTRGEVRELKPIAPDASSRTQDNRTAPYYWAAFQLSGDWR